MRTFDGSVLRPVGGGIYGHLFENPSAGVPRAVFWACSIDFAPLVVGDEEWVPQLVCEWITWPIRRWEQLDGHTLAASNGKIDPETSLYLFAQHQLVDSISLSLRHRHANRFTVQARAKLDVDDSEGGTIPNVIVDTEAEAVFEGLIVVPENLSPKPETALDATRALQSFADLSAYSEPRFDGLRWVFEPKVQSEVA